MKAETKKEFTRKITQANKTGLVVIVYEMFLTYIEDALKAYNELNRKEFVFNLDMARQCIWEMRNILNFNYNLSQNLFALYNFADRELAKDIFGCKNDNLEEIRMMFKKLHDAYEKISVQDTSKPLMQNTEEVYAGLTYGRYSLNETSSLQGAERGYRV